MADVVHGYFGLFGDKYYSVPDCGHIVIPQDSDYKTNVVQASLNAELSQCEIDCYSYHSDLTTDCNVDRVANFCDFLKGEKIKEIDEITDKYVLGIEYELYNNKGEMVKSGKSEIEAKYCNAVIIDNVKLNNVLEYRKGMIYDARIQICVPSMAKYGIKNAYNQHPYTLLIKSIKVYANASASYVESGSQMNTDGSYHEHEHHAYNASYRCHQHDTICRSGFAHCFLTDAHVGTTIIDHVVAPAELKTPDSYTLIELLIALGLSIR